jgi:acetyl-CoA carboxylase carboxyltransferase component
MNSIRPRDHSPFTIHLRLDAVIDPLDTRTWISMGIEAASQAPATREFNMGVLQT